MYYQFYERNIDFAKQEPHHFLREMQRKNNSLVFCTLPNKGDKTIKLSIT